MIKLSAEEILRIDEVIGYSAEHLKEAFDSLEKIKRKINNGVEIYASDIGYVMQIIDGIHELITRSLDNEEINGKKLSE